MVGTYEGAVRIEMVLRGEPWRMRLGLYSLYSSRGCLDHFGGKAKTDTVTQLKDKATWEFVEGNATASLSLGFLKIFIWN